jgi:thiol-disulfide isomerase/thioredoxin
LASLPDRLLERRIRSLDGKSFRLADFEGKVLVINVWASWCGPCRQEVPEYESVRKDYAGRNVQFIGLTPEDPAEATASVNRFVRATSFGFLIGWADGDMARALMNGRSSIPQTLVIDANGSIVNHWFGYARGRNGDRLRESIDNALK